LRDLLEPEGYKIFVAQDAQRALEIARTTISIEIIISDVVMPEMDGMELCRRLKKDPHTARFQYCSLVGFEKKKRRCGKDSRRALTITSRFLSAAKSYW